MSVAFILDAFANAKKIDKLLSKKSGTGKNSCCCNQTDNELGKIDHACYCSVMITMFS